MKPSDCFSPIQSLALTGGMLPYRCPARDAGGAACRRGVVIQSEPVYTGPARAIPRPPGRTGYCRF